MLFRTERRSANCSGTGDLVEEATDRRVRRTRELLRNALLSLIDEKGYDRITVQDILNKADVGRSTFYAHYRDKEDLLQSGFQDIQSELERTRAPEEPPQPGELLHPLLTVFEHVEGHRHRWRPLVRKGGADLVIRILRESVTNLVHEHFRSQFHSADPDATHLEAAVRFVVGACMDLLLWWLDDEEVTYTASEMHAAFQRLATKGVRDFLAG